MRHARSSTLLSRYKAGRHQITPTLAAGTGDVYDSDQSSWVAGGEAPLHTLVDRGDKIVDIAFHEVWWADINEAFSLGKQLRFWTWGLSLAGIATHHQQFLHDAADRTRLPKNHGKLTCWNRVRMGYVSALFGLSAFSIALVNLVLKRLSFDPILSTGVIVNYLSSVKLYSQDRRWGGGPMDGPDEPPRVAIRRRMIRVMVDVANKGYCRWYILAHSLGSIVAWNGVMEIAEALPNYIDQKCWENLATSDLRKDISQFDISAMLPSRPVWLGDRETIDRDVLFKNFRGLLTYGSPLERYCALWSAMVPINKDERRFHEESEWVNVYDPTDPVGTWINDFDPEPNSHDKAGRIPLKPQNFPCRASPILLLSHICYLTSSRLRSFRVVRNKDLLVDQVADWLVSGGSLAKRIRDVDKGFWTFWMPLASAGDRPAWQTRPRVIWRIAQWLIAGVTDVAHITVIATCDRAGHQRNSLCR